MLRWNLPQRVVASVGLAGALAAVAAWATTWRTGPLGWFAYAQYSPPPTLHHVLAPWARLLVWVGVVAVWTVGSLVIFQRAR